MTKIKKIIENWSINSCKSRAVVEDYIALRGSELRSKRFYGLGWVEYLNLIKKLK